MFSSELVQLFSTASFYDVILTVTGDVTSYSLTEDPVTSS